MQIAILEVENSKMYRSKFSVSEFLIMHNFPTLSSYLSFKQFLVFMIIFSATYHTLLFLRILIWTQAKSDYVSAGAKMSATSDWFNVCFARSGFTQSVSALAGNYSL